MEDHGKQVPTPLPSPADESTIEEQPGQDQIVLSWIDINYYTTNHPSRLVKLFRPKQYKAKFERRRVLEGIVGEVRSGEMMAIIGGPECGRTELFNVLAGRITGGEPSGTLLLNGSVGQNWRKIFVYVSSQDLFDKNVTVKELIQVRIDLRNNFNRANRRRKLAKLTALLELDDIIEKNVQDVSLYNRRKLSIAIELALEGRILFLDNPAADLDESDALRLFHIIRKISRKHGICVIVSIEHPSEEQLQLFNTVTLLSLGKLVYVGPWKVIVDHLTSLTHPCPLHENTADWAIDITSVDNSHGGVHKKDSLKLIARLHQAWSDTEEDFLKDLTRRRKSTKRSLLNLDEAGPSHRFRSLPKSRSSTSLFILTSTPDLNPSKVSMIKEFSILFVYNIRAELHRCIFLAIEFLVISLILGFVFFQLTTDNFGGFQSRVGLLALIPVVLIGVIVFETMNLFDLKGATIKNHRASHLCRFGSDYLASLLAVLLINLAIVILFSPIVYYLTGLRTESFSYFLIFTGCNLLICLFAILYGTFIASMNLRQVTNSLIYFISLYIFILFGGNLSQSQTITPILSWIRFLSPYFYYLQATVQTECNGLEIAGEPGAEFVSLFGLDQFSVMWNAGAIMIMCGAAFIAGLIGFYHTTKPNYKTV